MGPIRPMQKAEEPASTSSTVPRHANGPLFTVTVDVEADDEWNSTAPPHYRGIRALPQLQELCDHYGVQPTYLVTFDVASDRESVAILQELAASGRCEIGAHMHPWRTPPVHAGLDCQPGYRPYLYDYPEKIQAQKMENLTRHLEDTFHRPITSHRAGRWGLDLFGLDLLEEYGYLVDTSVTPLRDRRPQLGFAGGAEGPNFVDAPAKPYHPADSAVTLPGTRKVLEIPVSTGTVGAAFGSSWQRQLVRLSSRTGSFGEASMRALRKIKALRVVTLNPVRHEWGELMALLDRLLGAQRSVVNMCFHSSELVEGESPGVATAEDLRRVWHSIEAVANTVASTDGVWSSGLSTAARVLTRTDSSAP